MTAPGTDDLRRRLVNLRFPATAEAVRDTLLAVDSTLAEAGAAEDLRTRTQIALAEACNNIVEHAYAPPCDIADPAIVLDIAGDRGGLQVTLRDRGRAMPDGPLPSHDLPPMDPDDLFGLPEGGFGWALLRAMTRALSISHRNGQNILRFRLPHEDRPGHLDRPAI
jgi:serine/threonine-protein kinase RsbW